MRSDTEARGTNALTRVTKSRSAPFATPRLPSSHHVAPDRAGRVADTQLDGQLVGDAVLAPPGLVGAHAADQSDVFGRNARAAGLAGSPSPVAPESAQVPVDHRGRLDEGQR